MLNGYQKGLIEGALDSDGNISIGKRTDKRSKRGWSLDTKVRITNSSKSFLEKIKNVLNMGIIFSGSKKKGEWCLYFRKKEAITLLSQIELIVKKKAQRKYLRLQKLIEDRYRIGQKKYERKLILLVG